VGATLGGAVDGIIQTAAVIALLLMVGGAIGFTRRESFSLRWLLVAAGLVLLNDFLLTRGYGLLPHVIPKSAWNWQGKVLALAATLAVAALPAFGWRRSGLTFAQAEGSLKSCLLVALLYCGVFVVIALISPNESVSPETLAFQLTMPGLEEEPFYRGVLLLALDRAFTARARVLGADWGWGAVLSCALFGLAHAFNFSHGHVALDPMTMAVTALPAFIAVWMRLRTGSLLLPVLLHNFGNAIPLLL
jgi:membrane protease YdiL (CAAX protease family)